APFLGGGFGHFYAYAPQKYEYPINRYAMEVKRQLDVLDQQLAKNEYIAGDEFTIADIAIWPWYGLLVQGKIYEAGEFLGVNSYTNVLKWANKLSQRVGVKRGQIVNRVWGDDNQKLSNRNCANDIDEVLAK
ncbi:MAG: GST-like protein, partial [Kangiellaceae bacterium]